MRRPRAHLLDEDEAARAGRRAGVPDVLSRLNAFRALLGNEQLARALSDLLLSLLAGRALDPRLRELVIMRIGWVTRCDYEWAQHWSIATALGIPEDDLLGVRHWRDHPSFDDLERAVLEATDECLGGGRIDDPVMEVLQDRLSAEAIVELVAVIGSWTMVSTLLRSLDVPLEDGVASWPPHGAAPP